MGRKFGKKIVCQMDPLAYNYGLIGEAGIGKSTLAKQVCEKLVGDEGYISCNIGKEDGHDAIEGGIVSADIPNWEVWEEFIDDIIENRETDYKDLKIVIIDTYDELSRISDEEVVRRYNSKVSDLSKRVESITAAYGGYTRGEQKSIENILDSLWRLKSVGVHFFIIGHTKRRDIEDWTGQTYTTLTTNMRQSYFNAIKTKLHLLGVAHIDREIIKVKTAKKDFGGKDKYDGQVKSEVRRITFRDDNYSIDSKSRFAHIVDEIPMDADMFIKAIENAINENIENTDISESKEVIKKKQKEEATKAEKDNLKKIKDEKNNEALVEEIKSLLNEIDSINLKREMISVIVDAGYQKFTDEGIPCELLEKVIEVAKGGVTAKNE